MSTRDYGQVGLGKGERISVPCIIEPATIPVQGVISARAMTRVGTKELDQTQLTSPPRQASTDASASNVYVMLANFSQEELTLPKATGLGLAEEVSETLIYQINIGKQLYTESPTRPQRKTRNEDLYKKLLGGELDILTKNGKQLV